VEGHREGRWLSVSRCTASTHVTTIRARANRALTVFAYVLADLMSSSVPRKILKFHQRQLDPRARARARAFARPIFIPTDHRKHRLISTRHRGIPIPDRWPRTVPRTKLSVLGSIVQRDSCLTSDRLSLTLITRRDFGVILKENS